MHEVVVRRPTLQEPRSRAEYLSEGSAITGREAPAWGVRASRSAVPASEEPAHKQKQSRQENSTQVRRPSSVPQTRCNALVILLSVATGGALATVPRTRPIGRSPPTAPKPWPTYTTA